MPLFDTTQAVLERAMQGAAMRQSLLASNLANVNTPGYQRRDLDFHSALRAALATGTAPEAVDFRPVVGSATAARADGNGVDLDQESATLAENGLDYQALVQVAAARDEIVQVAMGSR